VVLGVQSAEWPGLYAFGERNSSKQGLKQWKKAEMLRR
jgi:hypothetical protein